MKNHSLKNSTNTVHANYHFYFNELIITYKCY